MPTRKGKRAAGLNSKAREPPVPPAWPQARPAAGLPKGPQAPNGFAVLASHVRYDILQALTVNPKTVRELTQELRMHRLTVRYHINFLLREGLVEEVHGSRPGTAGRPPVLYRTSRHARVPGFPPRRFELIAQSALATLLEALGQGDARARLFAKGKQVGSMSIKALGEANGVKRWTPDAYDQHMLKGSYREMGVTTEVLRKSSNEIHYRAFGCPFLELAEQMPEVVCDALDNGFHAGVTDGLGAVQTTRLRCMGHGDPFCEYVLTWQKGKRAKAPSAGGGKPALPKQEVRA